MISLVTNRKGKATGTNVSVGSSDAVQLLASNGSRKTAIFQNQGAVTVALSSTPDVVANASYWLVAGASFEDLYTDGPWWALAASSTAVIRCIEVS